MERLEIEDGLVNAVFDGIRLAQGDGVIPQECPQGEGGTLGQGVKEVSALQDGHNFAGGEGHQHSGHLAETKNCNQLEVFTDWEFFKVESISRRTWGMNLLKHLKGS